MDVNNEGRQSHVVFPFGSLQVVKHCSINVQSQIKNRRKIHEKVTGQIDTSKIDHYSINDETITYGKYFLFEKTK